MILGDCCLVWLVPEPLRYFSVTSVQCLIFNVVPFLSSWFRVLWYPSPATFLCLLYCRSCTSSFPLPASYCRHQLPCDQVISLYYLFDSSKLSLPKNKRKTYVTLFMRMLVKWTWTVVSTAVLSKMVNKHQEQKFCIQNKPKTVCDIVRGLKLIDHDKFLLIIIYKNL